MASVRFISLVLVLISFPGQLLQAEPVGSEAVLEAYRRAKSYHAEVGGKVLNEQITPHWLSEGSRFWYRLDRGEGKREFILVDPGQAIRQPAFNHDRLAASLSELLQRKIEPFRLPFDSIEILDAGKRVRFRIDNSTWQAKLPEVKVTRVVPEAGESTSPPPRGRNNPPRVRRDNEPGFAYWGDDEMEWTPRSRGPNSTPGGKSQGVPSPDGKWIAYTDHFNLYVSPSKPTDDLPARAVTTDGTAERYYQRPVWSPSGSTLLVLRTHPETIKPVHVIESSPADGGRAKLHTRPYALPGDPFTSHELWLFDPIKDRKTPVDIEPFAYGGPPKPRWSKDGKTFTVERGERSHQRFRLLEVDATTGKTRALIDEQQKTFVNIYTGFYLHYLDRTGEVIFRSERDGWSHLYLIDTRTGTVKNPITSGPWVVRSVDRVDEERRQIWFRACGKNPDQDPYLIHYYRVNFDGTGLTPLTSGNGTHTLTYSPSGDYCIDTYSRVDSPPIHELRRTEDGKLICELERADMSALKAQGWQPPEVFHAPGRDGKTEIWGIACRPLHFDPRKKYPVIEMIYAGPHDSHVPKRFSPHLEIQQLAQLGFITVQIDGMGTANRSKAFHDVCWQNLADAGFPDRIAWMKALAQKDPVVDITRVGVYGGSAGGQNAVGALLFHPEFYKVAVAFNGCHDNRMDKASWNEQWMGYPVGPHYAANSNITHAGKLQGKLFLSVGEMDNNVPPESTFRLVDALIKAGKDFDFIVLPGQGHTHGGQYGERRLWDFFVRHLQGQTPPDRNQSH